MASRALVAGGVVTALLFVLGLLYFMQTKDPMMLIFPVPLVLTAWVVVLVVHALRRGIPVRIVDDERKQ